MSIPIITNYIFHYPMSVKVGKTIFSSLVTSVSLLALVGYCLLLELKFSINIIRKNSDVPSQAVLKHDYYFSMNCNIIHHFMCFQADAIMDTKVLPCLLLFCFF